MSTRRGDSNPTSASGSSARQSPIRPERPNTVTTNSGRMVDRGDTVSSAAVVYGEIWHNDRKTVQGKLQSAMQPASAIWWFIFPFGNGGVTREFTA